MKWWLAILGTIPFVFVCAFIRFLQKRSQKAARLRDTTPMFAFGRYHFVSILQLQREGPQSGAALHLGVKGLREAISRNRGHLGYLGKSVSVVTPAAQLPIKTCDVVAHTNWANQSDFEAFRAEMQQTWAIHLVQAFDRPTVKNIIGAAVLHGLAPLLLKVKATLTGSKYDLTEEGVDQCDQDTPLLAERYTRASLRETADSIDAGNSDEPMLWWNLEGEHGPTTVKYGMAVMPILIYHGAGGMHAGNLRQDYHAKDGGFVNMAAVYYPSRRFASQLLRSHQMYKAVQDKDVGDSICVATVPFTD